MYIGEDKYGMIMLFTESNQYSFDIEQPLFQYKNHCQLDCSFEEALKYKDEFKKIYHLLKLSAVCSGALIRKEKI